MYVTSFLTGFIKTRLQERATHESCSIARTIRWNFGSDCIISLVMLFSKFGTVTCLAGCASRFIFFSACCVGSLKNGFHVFIVYVWKSWGWTHKVIYKFLITQKINTLAQVRKTLTNCRYSSRYSHINRATSQFHTVAKICGKTLPLVHGQSERSPGGRCLRSIMMKKVGFQQANVHNFPKREQIARFSKVICHLGSQSFLIWCYVVWKFECGSFLSVWIWPMLSQ